jgi:hypothetical protein
MSASVGSWLAVEVRSGRIRPLPVPLLIQQLIGSSEKERWSMNRSSAAISSAAFFVAAPGTVVGLIPWLITGWEIHQPVAGAPMPIAPTQQLVVSGFKRIDALERAHTAFGH